MTRDLMYVNGMLGQGGSKLLGDFSQDIELVSAQ